MYQCENCKSVFDKPNKILTDEGIFAICPNCRYGEIEEISICQKCGNPSMLHEMYCESCKNHIRDTMSQATNFLTDAHGFDRTETFRIISEWVEREG